MGNVPELPAGTDTVLPRGESHLSRGHAACPAPMARTVQSPGYGQWVSANPPGHVPPRGRGSSMTPPAPTHSSPTKTTHTCLFGCVVTGRSPLFTNI